MWVEAILSTDDVTAVITDLCPLTIHLGQDPADEQYIRLSNPKDVSIVEDRGLRFTCNAEIRWPVLGIDVPIGVESITMTLSPAVAPDLGEHVLAFRPELENIDLSWIPEMFDQRILDKINHELEKKHVELSWHFAETLSHRFGLPSFLLPIAALDVEVAWGKVRVTSEAMVMAVSFHTRVVRHQQGALDPIAVEPAEDHARVALERPRRRDRGVRVSTPVAAFAATALAGMSVYMAIGAMTWTWRFLRRSA
jgi:hypothetical protein